MFVIILYQFMASKSNNYSRFNKEVDKSNISAEKICFSTDLGHLMKLDSNY